MQWLIADKVCLCYILCYCFVDMFYFTCIILLSLDFAVCLKKVFFLKLLFMMAEVCIFNLLLLKSY